MELEPKPGASELCCSADCAVEFFGDSKQFFEK